MRISANQQQQQQQQNTNLLTHNYETLKYNYVTVFHNHDLFFSWSLKKQQHFQLV